MYKIRVIFIWIFSLLLSIVPGCVKQKYYRGIAYLVAASSSYVPLCEYRELDKSGRVLYTLKSHTGKFVIFNKAFEEEITQARDLYPDLALAADTSQAAFRDSELSARERARTNAQIEVASYKDLPWDCWQTPEQPPVPVEFKEKEDLWNLSWKTGWSCNHRRYYKWYKQHEFEDLSEVDTDENIIHKKELQEVGQKLPKPNYDSGWLLYDPGEFKILNHNLLVSPKKMVVVITSMFKSGRSASVSRKGHSFKNACWSDLTVRSIRVQRHYDDDTIDAIRIRIWIHE